MNIINVAVRIKEVQINRVRISEGSLYIIVFAHASTQPHICRLPNVELAIDPLQWAFPHYIIICGGHVGGQPRAVIPLCTVETWS